MKSLTVNKRLLSKVNIFRARILTLITLSFYGALSFAQNSPESIAKTFFTNFKEQSKGFIETGSLVISIVAFIWVAWMAISKFRECQTGRADWGELITISIVGAALLVVIGLLLSSAGTAKDELK